GDWSSDVCSSDLGPWAPLAGSLRAGQARGLRSQARFAQGRPVGSARRLASRRASDEGSIQLLVIGARVADPSQAQDDTPRKKSWEAFSREGARSREHAVPPRRKTSPTRWLRARAACQCTESSLLLVDTVSLWTSLVRFRMFSDSCNSSSFCFSSCCTSSHW